MARGSQTKTLESPALKRGFLHHDDGTAARLYLRPLNAGARLAEPLYEVLVRRGGETVTTAAPASALRSWAQAEGEAVERRVAGLLARITHSPKRFAGADLDQPVLMGILNVTPDSFSDGGDFADSRKAIEHGRFLAKAGAAFLDVGGESTRPGADPVSLDEERGRVIPVVRALAAEGYRVSIDTRHATVMKAAVEAGAMVINDVTALTGDPDSLSTTAASGADVVLMHMQGEPGTMQADPHYDDALLDIYDYLEERVAACEAAGIAREKIAVDPGIGFGKTVEHNTRLLGRLGIFLGLGCAVLLGVSRKTFIGRLSAEEPPKERLPGSLAAALAGVREGARILRVHDVRETRQALSVWNAIQPKS